MWIFTDTGFISIVRKPERPDSLTVRARDRKSLEALAALASAEIKRSPHGDYPYRVFVGDAEFNQWLFSRTAELDYSNFKNQVAKTRGSKFAHLLHDVWAAMLGAEDDESRTPVLDANGNELAHTDGTPLPTGKVRVTITQSDREMANHLGISVEDYAREKARSERAQQTTSQYTEIL